MILDKLDFSGFNLLVYTFNLEGVYFSTAFALNRLVNSYKGLSFSPKTILKV